MTDRELNATVAAHLPLARKYARLFAKRFYLEEDDVFELALENLARAAQTWEPEKGLSFGRYVLRYMPAILNHQCVGLYREQARKEISFQFVQADRDGQTTRGRCTTASTGDLGSFESIFPERATGCYCNHARRQAWNVIATLLDVREWMIIAYHYGVEPLPRLTFPEIGQRLGVSKQRVQQIEARAVEKVRKAYSTQEGRMALEALRDYVVAKSA